MKKFLSALIAATMVLGCGAAVPGVSGSSTVLTASAEPCATTVLNSMSREYANAKDIDAVVSSNGYIALTSPDSMDINIYDLATGGNVRTLQKRHLDDRLLGLRSDLTLITSSPHDEGFYILFDVLFYSNDSSEYKEVTVLHDFLYFYDERVFYLNDSKLYIVEEDGTDEQKDTVKDYTSFSRSSDPLSIKQGAYFDHKKTTEDKMFPEYDLYMKDLYTSEIKTTAKLKGYSGNPKRGHADFTSDSFVFIPDKVTNNLKQPFITCFDYRSGAIKYSFEMERYCDYYFSEKSPYAFIGYDEPKAADEGYIRADDGYLRFVDPGNGKAARIATGGEGMLRSEGFCIDENKWLVYVVYKTDEGTDTEVYYVDLEKEASFDTKLKGKTEWYPVADELKDARKRADEIEAKYGITIIFGDEILDLDEATETSFVGQEYYDGRLKDLPMAERFDMLDSRLSKLPEGFLKEFRNKEGKCGLILRYVHYINGGMADTAQTDDWYAITANMDCTTGFAIEHEMFHAVEDLVKQTDPITEAEWSALDPEGFERYNVWAEGVVHPDLYVGATEDPYFLTFACMGNSGEDRAIMIGNLFLNADGDDTYTGCYYPKHYTDNTKYPHLKAKYDYLEQWEKDYFGYAHWKIAIGLDKMPVKGDVTLNGKIEIDDAVSVIGNVNGQVPLKRGPYKYADVNDSDTVDIEDAVAIIGHINGLKAID